jgi:heme exporter protein B
VTPRQVLADALLVAGKDLRLELRAKVGMVQIVPFALTVLILFAFALDPDRGVLDRATPGLFWVAVLFSSVLTIQRAFAVESDDGVLDALRLSGLPAAAVFWGKVAALVLQLLALELVLAAGVVVFYGTTLRAPGLLAVVALAATAGIAASGAVYGALSARLRSRDTLLPLLMLPLLAPVLISATRGVEVGLDGSGAGGWSWAALLGVFAVVYLALGSFLFRPLLEDA